uniref:Uncharacterized protein n=1 Tax=Kalanchoe fedtschenkoi TaxID=63787 RepID=A0A7N0VKU7_KALFE
MTPSPFLSAYCKARHALQLPQRDPRALKSSVSSFLVSSMFGFSSADFDDACRSRFFRPSAAGELLSLPEEKLAHLGTKKPIQLFCFLS